jgi:hypothetical protein
MTDQATPGDSGPIYASYDALVASAQDAHRAADDLAAVGKLIESAAKGAAAVNFCTFSPAALSACASLAACVSQNVSEVRAHADTLSRAADDMKNKQGTATSGLSKVTVDI